MGGYLNNISFLEKNKNIKSLIISEFSFIKDYTPISKLDKLEFLKLYHTDINSLLFLENCKNINDLNLSYLYKKIDDFTPISKLDKLETLPILKTNICVNF